MSRKIANLIEDGYLAYGYDKPFSSYFIQHYSADHELLREWASDPLLIDIGEVRPHNNGEMLEVLLTFKDDVIEESLDEYLEAIQAISLDLPI